MLWFSLRMYPMLRNLCITLTLGAVFAASASAYAGNAGA